MRLVSTYSIVACDTRTGELGMGVQSHYFSAGTVVPWLEPGVGAIATQAFANVAYGPRGLALLARGESPRRALDRLLEEDAGRELRQVAVMDASGAAAAHTGAACVPAAGHRLADGCVALGNMLRSDAAWPAMAVAYQSGEGDLAVRLLAALEAGERKGGDLRGRRSAALLVVSTMRSERPWEGRRIDLRVDDHPEPLLELRRLLAAQRAQRLLERALGAAAAGDLAGGLRDLAEAQKLCPDNPEFSFWAGIGLANAGRLDEARAMLDVAYAAHPGWAELLRRLPAAGLLPGDRGLLERLAGGREGPA